MSTDIVPTQYAALEAANSISQTLAENLDGETIGPQDLPRAKMPSGGGTSWEVPKLGGSEATKEIRGIVVHTQQTRAYWPGKMLSNSPPQCSSTDAVTGVGTPGGDCQTCPLAQFGTAVNPDGSEARGQACKLSRQVFLLQSDALLPLVVSLPPTSLKAWRTYVLGLVNAQIPLSGVETVFSLDATKNADGTGYSHAVLAPGRRLEDVEEAQARGYSSAIKPLLVASAGAFIGTE